MNAPLPTQNTPSGGTERSAPRYSKGPNLVDRIKSKLSLDKYLEPIMELKKGGKGELVGKCNMHDDKTASLHVNTELGVYHCKGCGESGNVIQMHAFIHNLSYEDAKKDLGRQLGVYTDKVLDNGEAILARAANLYAGQLQRKENALEYLKSRGLNQDTIERFGIGFCWGREYMDLTPKQQDMALQAGLMKEDSKKSWLAGRIVFPVREKNGRIVGFGGRLVPSDNYVPTGPKYMNTPETAYFKKSELLYGLYEASGGISRAGRAIVVEGYMDVAMLHQTGVNNAVAAMGAQATENAFKLLWSVTKNIVFCLDGDKAGVTGGMRSVMAAAPTMPDGGMISIATMPAGVDPDEYVIEHGQSAFDAHCDQAVPLAKYLMDSKVNDFDLASPEGRAGLIKAAQELGATFNSAPIVAEQLEEEARALCASALVESTLRRMELPAVLDQRDVEMAIGLLQKLVSDVPRQTGRERIAAIRRQTLSARRPAGA
ncbi:DNA primase [Hydrogenophaga sp. 2FB]|uniref:DNA primase n=1 Tax=Hydrogenophaga sp. 2FB TaxID=2502187 RepID=UPI0010FA398F|nr:DNA primase [Hydrogenophaga sp. 2FB]